MSLCTLCVGLLSILCFALPAAPSPGPTRQVVPARDPAGARFQVALQGGHTDAAGSLRAARVVIRTEAGMPCWDDFDPNLHPWLLRSGRFAGREVLLIGVRKSTIFDPPERPRPFLYALKPAGRGLTKVWLGTSLSRPLVTATFGDLDGQGEDELVALERTASGGIALGAYQWEGFGVEGLARSQEVAAARDVACADVCGDGVAEAVVFSAQGTRWGFRAFGLQGEHLVPVAEAAATAPARPATWVLVPATNGTMGAVRLSSGRATRTLRFRAIAAGARGSAPWPPGT